MLIFSKFIVFLLAILSFFPGQLTKAYVGNTRVFVKIARTPAELQQGLSDIKIMNSNQGMLFMFDKKARFTFWMKDMNFDLDFIWISQGNVVDITENILSPKANNNEINQVSPKIPVDMVLEVRSGFIKQNKINLGDKFYFEI